MTSHPLLVDIVVYDGVDEIDALGPLEVLRSAAAARRPTSPPAS